MASHAVTLTRSKAGGKQGSQQQDREPDQVGGMEYLPLQRGMAREHRLPLMLEIRADGGAEIHALKEKLHVTLDNIQWSRPKFEISSEGTASPLIPTLSTPGQWFKDDSEGRLPFPDSPSPFPVAWPFMSPSRYQLLK